MADEAVTLTPEQKQQELATHLAKVASIAPQIIIDRLTRVHGHQINSDEEAQLAVKSAMDLFYMKQAGLVSFETPKVESNNPLIKAAKEVSDIADKIRNEQAGDVRVSQAVLSDDDLLKSAREIVRLSA